MNAIRNTVLLFVTASVMIFAGCGSVTNAPVTMKVASNADSLASTTAPTTATVISNIQTATGNWQKWLQFAPDYVDCATPCQGNSIEVEYNVADPSESGSATMFELNAVTAYADALFSAQLIGQNSPQIPDAKHTLLPSIHNFTYDADFYVVRSTITQELEFDVSMYMNGAGMIWGHECNHLGDGDWDIWDNVNNKWVSAGVPCTFTDGWNHLTINMQRGDDNSLLYQSITLNGTTYTINKTYPAGTADSGWWGMTANYQMDGNKTPDMNTTYLDNFTVTYW
jgi:hypothetical protein